MPLVDSGLIKTSLTLIAGSEGNHNNNNTCSKLYDEKQDLKKYPKSVNMPKEMQKQNEKEITHFKLVMPSKKKQQHFTKPGTFSCPPDSIANAALTLALLSNKKASPRPKSVKKKSKPSTKDNSKIPAGIQIHSKIPTTQKKRPNTTKADFAGPGTFVSTFGKFAVHSLTPPKLMTTSKKSKLAPKTQVVLAPRFGPDSSEPSTLNVVQEDERNVFLNRPEFSRAKTAPPAQIWRKRSSSFLLNPNTNFPPEKAKWVQMALDNLGETWVAEGAIPPHMMEFPEFQGKIGELYDLAVNKKRTQISKLVEPNKIPSNKSSLTKRKKGAAQALEKELQNKVSDIVLQALLEKLLPSTSFEETKTKQDACTDTRMDSYMNECGDIENGNSTGLINGRRHSTEVEDDSTKEIKNFFINEGRICPQEFPYKVAISSFAPLSESRKRKDPSLSNYFRRTVSLRGFEAEEMKFKYSKTRIFVEGKQQQKEDRNARLVREIIMLPHGLHINDLKVMRGIRGTVVFEEVYKPPIHESLKKVLS